MGHWLHPPPHPHLCLPHCPPQPEEAGSLHSSRDICRASQGLRRQPVVTSSLAGPVMWSKAQAWAPSESQGCWAPGKQRSSGTEVRGDTRHCQVMTTSDTKDQVDSSHWAWLTCERVPRRHGSKHGRLPCTQWRLKPPPLGEEETNW